jgi:hypothetical protein
MIQGSLLVQLLPTGTLRARVESWVILRIIAQIRHRQPYSGIFGLHKHYRHISMTAPTPNSRFYLLREHLHNSFRPSQNLREEPHTENLPAQ